MTRRITFIAFFAILAFLFTSNLASAQTAASAPAATAAPKAAATAPVKKVTTKKHRRHHRFVAVSNSKALRQITVSQDATPVDVAQIWFEQAGKKVTTIKVNTDTPAKVDVKSADASKTLKFLEAIGQDKVVLDPKLATGELTFSGGSAGRTEVWVSYSDSSAKNKITVEVVRGASLQSLVLDNATTTLISGSDGQAVTVTATSQGGWDINTPLRFLPHGAIKIEPSATDPMSFTLKPLGKINSERTFAVDVLAVGYNQKATINVTLSPVQVTGPLSIAANSETDLNSITWSFNDGQAHDNFKVIGVQVQKDGGNEPAKVLLKNSHTVAGNTAAKGSNCYLVLNTNMGRMKVLAQVS